MTWYLNPHQLPGFGPPVAQAGPPMQQNQVIMPMVPRRVDVALATLRTLDMARTNYGVDGSTRQRDLSQIEEHTYEIALMTLARYLKGDEFNEHVAVVPVVQPVNEKRN